MARTVDTPRDPAITAVAVTPSDSVALTSFSRGIYVGGAGDLTVVMAADASLTPVTFASVAAGSLLPISVSYVMSTNTTATSIVALK